MVPETYRSQDGCYNCKHVFERVDYDTTTSGGDYYCMVDNEQRPHSGSIALESNKGFDPSAWSEWANTHFVQPAGICDKWEKRDQMELESIWTPETDGEWTT